MKARAGLSLSLGLSSISLRSSKRSALVSAQCHNQYHLWARNDPYTAATQDDRFGLAMTDSSGVPHVSKPSDLLIRVKGASVNPIDVRMSGGYGRNMLGLYNLVNSASEFQQSAAVKVLGRDFSGVVEVVGQAVTQYSVGDKVYGALKAIDEGAHAEYVLADEDSIAFKPRNLSHIEAASIPYVALTFISAVNPLGCSSLAGQRVFLNGGSGGIGSFAIQYLRSLNCEVTVAVSQSGRALVEQLQPDHIINYQSNTFTSDLQSLSGFDLAFDCVGDESALPYVKPGGRFVTVVSPLLSETDELGLIAGSASALLTLSQKAYAAFTNHQVIYHWGFFMPGGTVLQQITSLVEQGKILPVIDEVFKFDQLPAAYDKVSRGQGRGKTVIDMS